jgi:hypothetical protein
VQGVLVIDVECWREVDDNGKAILPKPPSTNTATSTTAAEIKEQRIAPLRLGQFEMRRTQLYVSNSLKAVFDSTLRPTTLPTRYSKLYWTADATRVNCKSVPSYELKNQLPESGDRQPSMQQPFLIDYPLKETRDLSWTLSFDDSPASRPVGLVVDVNTTSSGAQTFFARPRAAAVSSGPDDFATADTFPFHHTFSNDLFEAAITGSSIDKIYSTIRSKSDDYNAFGWLPPPFIMSSLTHIQSITGSWACTRCRC